MLLLLASNSGAWRERRLSNRQLKAAYTAAARKQLLRTMYIYIYYYEG